MTSTAVTTTVTASEISTQFISVIQASSPADGQAAYSFTEENGTTTWLGATPGTLFWSDSFLFDTSFWTRTYILGAGKGCLPQICPRALSYQSTTCHKMGFFPFVMLLDLSEKLSFVFCYGLLLSFCPLDLSHELDLPYETGMLTPQSLSAASASLVTSIQVVTLQPVPPGYVTPQGVTPVTSYLTLSSNETITETRTETQTLATSTESASAGAYTGLASKGWNSSISTFITVKSTGIGSVTAAEKYHPGMAYLLAPSGIVPFTPGNATRHIKVRDVVDIVVATIDGVPVSWTNNYDGTSLSSSDASPIVVPVTATALQPEAEPSRKFTRLLTGP